LAVDPVGGALNYVIALLLPPIEHGCNKKSAKRSEPNSSKQSQQTPRYV
jgi:hypothetical protein